jgi:hypothetical protein
MLQHGTKGVPFADRGLTCSTGKKESSTSTTIQIGESKNCVEIDTLIEYNTNTLMIGLTDDLPVNTLYGLQFILQAQIIPDYDQELATSLLFDEKKKFDLDLEHPQILTVEHIIQLAEHFMETSEGDTEH